MLRLNRNRQKLRDPNLLQDGGYAIDQFNTGNLSARQLRRLNRRIDKANSGSHRLQNRLQEQLNVQNLFALEQQGYKVKPLDGNTFSVIDPNGNQSKVDISNGRAGAFNNILGKAISGASQFVPGVGQIGNVIGQGLQGNLTPRATNAGQFLSQVGQPQQQGAGMFGGMGGGMFSGLGSLGAIGGLLGQIANGGNDQPISPQNNNQSSGFNGGFFNIGNIGLPQNGGGGMPPQGGSGFNIGQTLSSLGSIASIFQGMGGFGQGIFRKGGRVQKFQEGGQPQGGGMVDIQAEKGELILHPTGYLTPVHAKRSHNAMERSGDGDMITDHPLDGSFIFSDYLKIKKSDADGLIVGVKRYPYEEGSKGKEPEIFSVGDLFGKKEKKKTPAQLAQRVSKIFKITNDTNDIFNILGDQFNLTNRVPYLDGLSTLSEIERERDDTKEAIDELEDMIVAKKGGRLKSRRIRQMGYQSGGTTFPGGSDGGYGIPGDYGVVSGYGLPPGYTPPPMYVDPYQYGQGQTDNTYGTYTPSQPYDVVNPLPSNPLGPVTSTTTPPFNPTQEMGNILDPTISQWDQQKAAIQQLLQQQANGQVVTQFEDKGSPFLRGLGQVAIPVGGAINLGANVAGAIGAYDLNSRFINENKTFFAGQQDLVNQARDTASAGNLFDVGLNFLQQGPVDQTLQDSSRIKQFDPYRQVNMSRQLADQSLGQINSLVRNNPDNRGLNIGSAIATNNQSIASAYNNAQQQEFGINQLLDQQDYQNQQITTGNQQRRVDFGNSLIQGARPGFQGYFSNEASRPLDIAGLNSAQRQADISFRQNRLTQPVEYLSAAGNSLANLGASAISLGTNYVPQQVPIGATQQGGAGFNINQTINGLGNLAGILGNLGVFGKEKGGIVTGQWKRRRK